MPYSNLVALAELIGPYIKKKDTVMRMSIPPSERLALAIRFLATGESFQSLSFQFRIGKATVSGIVTEVCEAIYDVLGKDLLQTPNQADKWNEIAEVFYSSWNIPNNFRAIDGKRILIQKPAYAGSHFHDCSIYDVIVHCVTEGYYGCRGTHGVRCV